MSHWAAEERVVASGQKQLVRATFRDYIEVTKPKHQFVLFTCWVTMRLAASDLSWHFALITLIGTGLAVASSHVFNQIIDREFDTRMERTKNRPLASGRMDVRSAVLFGTVLGLLSLLIMMWHTNLLAVLCTFIGWFFYVVPYSYWLKQRSPWSTLVGGVSGAMPTVIGWTAVTGKLAPVPILFFLVMAIWQSPHFFALSLFRVDDYRRANYPVVVVRYGRVRTLRRMLWQTPIMVVCSILLFFVGAAGWIYLTTAVLLGALYLGLIARAYRMGEAGAAAWGKRLFHFSYLYLFLIYGMAFIDRIPSS